MSSSGRGGIMANKKLFDAHCHLQDPRIYNVAPQLIRTAMDSGVIRFAVNGVSEKDWHLVKQMGEQYPRSIIPCFGLHPWYVAERTPNWFNTLKDLFDSTPSATVGEIGLDKGSHGKKIDFVDQGYTFSVQYHPGKENKVQVFQQQLELAKELQKPVSIHCVRAFGDLLAIMQNVGPFPGGAILHSYLGSAEMVPGLAKLGAYFSFSGYLMSMKPQKAKKMLKSVPTERILLESDSPDALPILKIDSLQWVPGDSSVPEELHHKGKDSSNIKDPVDGQFHASRDASTLPKETLNHPANIHNVLSYVASLLEMPEDEIAEISYQNALHLFSSYPGSEIDKE